MLLQAEGDRLVLLRQFASAYPSVYSSMPYPSQSEELEAKWVAVDPLFPVPGLQRYTGTVEDPCELLYK